MRLVIELATDNPQTAQRCLEWALRGIEDGADQEWIEARVVPLEEDDD